MANIHVAEFAGIGDQFDTVQAPRDLVASQVVAIGATSASITNPLNDSTTLISVFAEADCYISLGTGTLDAAVAPNIPIAAGTYRMISVYQRSNFKVAAVERTVA